MRLIVRPWWHLTSLGRLDLDISHVVVSITSPPPEGQPVEISHRRNLRDILHLSFHDVNLDGLHDPAHIHNGRPMQLWAMQPQHAQAIWGFVGRWKGEVGAVVVHCEAGISRSPSVAMALADGLGWGRDCIDWLARDHDPHGLPPNPYVYRIMRACQPVNG